MKTALLIILLLALLVQPALAFENINPSDIHYYEFPEGCRPLFSGLRESIPAHQLWGLMLAGLIDGINPCAFAVIIFLTSMLALLKASRKQIMLVGGAYTFAVFLTYLLLGLGMLKAISALITPSGARIFTYCVAGFTFTLGLLSLHDGLVYARSGKADRMKLRLPGALRSKIHRIIRGRLSKGNLVAGAFITGCFVSLIDSLCTGQIYLPALALISRTQARYFYLLLYNLMFILPLVIVLTAVYLGLGFRRLIGLSERYTALTKLLLAGVFFALAGLLVFTA